RLTRVLPGLLAASRQPTDLTELCDPKGMPSHCARVDIFAARLLHKHASFRQAPLECIGRAQACHNRSRKATPVTGGTTEGQALLQHPDSVFQVPLGEV